MTDAAERKLTVRRAQLSTTLLSSLSGFGAPCAAQADLELSIAKTGLKLEILHLGLPSDPPHPITFISFQKDKRIFGSGCHHITLAGLKLGMQTRLLELTEIHLGLKH